ncbi:MAG: hypothetical protein GY778_16710 [bacterium]|nr:hypothetical protein [bacterium]
MSERATRFGLYLSDLNRRKTASHGNADLQLTIVGPLSRRAELLLQKSSGNRLKRVLSSPELAVARETLKAYRQVASGE